jgi:hypothetical protein
MEALRRVCLCVVLWVHWRRCLCVGEVCEHGHFVRGGVHARHFVRGGVHHGVRRQWCAADWHVARTVGHIALHTVACVVENVQTTQKIVRFAKKCPQ